MRDSLLLNTLKNFDKKQWNTFNAFVRSPYFNKNADKEKDALIDLLNYIQLYRNNFDSQEMRIEVVFQYIYPDEIFRKNKLEKLMSNLLDLAKRFIAVEYSEENTSFFKALHLAKFYRGINWEKRFYSEIKNLKKILQKIPFKDSSYFLRLLMIEQEVAGFENNINRRKGDLNLENTIKAADLFYLMLKLKFTGNLNQQQKFITIEPSNSLIPIDVLPLQDIAKASADYPLLLIYVKILEILNGPDDFDKAFLEYRNLLKVYYEEIPREDLQSLYAYLRNFCTDRYNQGHSEYLEILFQIYNELLESGFTIENNRLPHSVFTNHVIVALKLKKYDWVNSFLEKYQDDISGTNYPHEVYNLNFANYYLHIKKFDDAWDILSLKYEDPSYYRTARRMEVKILFEKKEYDLLDAKMNAFKAFVARINPKLISEAKKMMNYAFVNFLQQIIHPKTLNNLKRIKKIEQKIIQHESVAEREWLLDKTDELKKESGTSS